MARSAETDGLDTAAKRLRSIQEEPVKSAQGALSYDAFFGSP